MKIMVGCCRDDSHDQQGRQRSQAAGGMESRTRRIGMAGSICESRAAAIHLPFRSQRSKPAADVISAAPPRQVPRFCPSPGLRAVRRRPSRRPPNARDDPFDGAARRRDSERTVGEARSGGQPGTTPSCSPNGRVVLVVRPPFGTATDDAVVAIRLHRRGACCALSALAGPLEWLTLRAS